MSGSALYGDMVTIHGDMATIHGYMATINLSVVTHIAHYMTLCHITRV